MNNEPEEVGSERTLVSFLSSSLSPLPNLPNLSTPHSTKTHTQLEEETLKELLISLEEEMEVKDLLKDKKFWVASCLIAWAAALQGHMMWLQRQDVFKQKFGTLDETKDQEDH